MADNSRLAALEVLEKCRRSGAWSSAAIDNVIKKYSLDTKQAALTSALSLGVIQNSSLCDFYIDCFSSSSKIEPKVRDILREAIYQMLFMDRIPQSAAVNEAVLLTKKLGYSRASGFVNAILRKVCANIDNLPEIPYDDKAEYLSIKYSHPKWLAERLISEKGFEFTKAFFAENNIAPETCIQINTLKTDIASLSEKFSAAGIEYKNHEWLPDALVVSGNVTKLPGFCEGEFYVQDPAAKCAVLIADIQPGMSVLDACSAPGGKSFAAAIRMQNIGKILSCDLHEKKLNLIKSGADRLGIDIISTEACDARKPRNDEFDLVIADVPCSGLGVIRKKPEIRMKDEAELSNLPDIQYAILDNVSKYIKIGGELIYSTCTVLRAENEEIVSRFIIEHSDFSAVDFILPNGNSSDNGMYTFWPNVDGTDGFFVCKLRRNK